MEDIRKNQKICISAYRYIVQCSSYESFFTGQTVLWRLKHVELSKSKGIGSPEPTSSAEFVVR